MISVILIEPEWASNIGAVARVMGNFGFDELVLVNPKCRIDELDAIKRAKHALTILKRAKIVDFDYLDNFDCLVATTSKLGSDYNIPRSPISPENLAEKLKIDTNKKIGLVFGREGQGLKNNEIKKCDFIVTIPAYAKYPVMNISHAVGVILYSIFRVRNENIITAKFPLVSSKEKKKLLELIDSMLDNIEFSTKEKRETQKIIWRRMLGKSFLTRREAFALFGFFKKIK